MVDDELWPRHPIGRSVVALLDGEISWEQFDEIVERRNAARAG
jgi:hypothetical protein